MDRHKLLQILVNLLSNARHALMESAAPDKRLTSCASTASPRSGCASRWPTTAWASRPENLPRIFTQGFTTKKDGHGFGLHISALAAEEMDGGLTCTSPGPGQGATFTIDLPLTAEQDRA